VRECNQRAKKNKRAHEGKRGPSKSLILCDGQSITFLLGHFPGAWNFVFWCLSFYCRSCHSHLFPSPPFWIFRVFCLTLVEGDGFLCPIQGLLLRPIFSNSVHSVDESVFSPRTRFVDFFIPIARAFLNRLILRSNFPY